MTAAAESSVPTVTLWFDATCPWAWMTSRWVDEVARHRRLDVRWRVMSQAYLNEGEDVSPRFAALLLRSLHSSRVLTAARLGHGREVVKPLYDAIGTRTHPGRRRDMEAILAESLDEVGLPDGLVDAAGSDEVDPELRAEHDEAVERVGTDVGTPVVAIGEVAFFGPVVSPAPTGEAALRLFDAVAMAASVDGFFELKRTRTRGPVLA